MQQHTWHKMLFWKHLFKHIKLLMLCKVEPIQNASSFKRNPGQKFLKYMYQEAQAHVQIEKSYQHKSMSYHYRQQKKRTRRCIKIQKQVAETKKSGCSKKKLLSPPPLHKIKQT